MDTKEEQRNEAIRERTVPHLARRRALVRDGDKNTVVDVVGDVMALLADDHIGELVIESQHVPRAVIGKKFGDLVDKVLADHAEADAIREVEAIERAARDDPDNCKPKRCGVALWLREQEEKFQ